jgi:hypothetical protein
MPPRPSLLPKNGAYHPPNDVNTYRDLLLFEERLKTNAASLNRRKRRYECVLVLPPFLCILCLYMHSSFPYATTVDHNFSAI